MSRYRELGVDVKKPGVEKFKNVVDNLFPDAFCVIHKDPTAEDNGLVLHTDSAGSKPILSYLMYRETGDPSWFKGLAQDALAMNLNDVFCVGAQPVSFVDYVAFNTFDINRISLLGALSEGFSECLEALRSEGIKISFAGGETADLPDLLRTLDVSVTVFGTVPLIHVIDGSKVKPGDVIIGVRSGGKARFEQAVNTGIMSNGHTLARSCLLKQGYLEKYPELSYPGKGRLNGRYGIGDILPELGKKVGEALLSPTRLFAPIAKAVLEEHRCKVHGIVHNTGGGQTKCLRVGKGLRYVKNHLPDPDPIFNLIQREGKVDWREMYQVFNMGIGFEFIVDPSAVDDVVEVSRSFGVDAQVIGSIEKGKAKNTLVIETKFGKFVYD